MAAPTLPSHCCCCSLRIGVLCVGVLFVVVSIVLLVFSSIFSVVATNCYVYKCQDENNCEMNTVPCKDSENIFGHQMGLLATLNAVMLLTSGVLIWAAIDGRRWCLMMWLIVVTTWFTAHFVVVVPAFFVLRQFVPVLLATLGALLYTALAAAGAITVTSYWFMLKRNDQVSPVVGET